MWKQIIDNYFKSLLKMNSSLEGWGMLMDEQTCKGWVYVRMFCIYCNYLLPIWRRDLGILSQEAPQGKYSILHVLSRGRQAVVSLVCNCWLLPPLAIEFQIHVQEHSYIGTSSQSFCFPEYLLPSLGYWLFHDSHLYVCWLSWSQLNGVYPSCRR